MKYLAPACLALMLLAVLAVGMAEIHDFDTFWQLQSGRYMVEHREFIRADLFTLTPDIPRFEHCADITDTDLGLETVDLFLQIARNLLDQIRHFQLPPQANSSRFRLKVQPDAFL